MHRNVISIGVLSVLLGLGGIAAFPWAAGSVANEIQPATAHTAAGRDAPFIRKAAPVASSTAKKRKPFVASVIVQPMPTILPVVDQIGITENHKKIATAVLNALPAACRDNLETFAVLYKGATRRGLGGKTTIILDGSVPDEEFAALLVHECGHVIHSNMPGTSAGGLTTFADGPNPFYADSPIVAFWNISWKTTTSRKAGKDADFVSGYAKSNPFEEFSETFAAYVLQRGALRERAKTNDAIAAKLFWMEANLPLKENVIGNGTATWTGDVPWDVTKLPLTLAAR